MRASGRLVPKTDLKPSQGAQLDAVSHGGIHSMCFKEEVLGIPSNLLAQAS